MAFPDSDIQSISGAPQPPPPLSGLLFGGGMGFSGSPEQQGGGLAGGRGGPGMQAGPSLAELLQMMSQGGGGEAGGAAIPNLNLFQGALGQAPGGFGGLGGIQSPFAQTIGQQGQAGQTAGATGGSQGDVLGLLKSLFSVGQKGTDLFSTLQSGAPGTELQTGTGQVGGYSLYGQPGTASPTVGGPDLQQDLTGSLTGTNILQDPTLQLFNTGLLSGSLTPQMLDQFNTLSPALQQQYANALFGGQIGPSLGESLQAGDTSGFNLGVGPLGGGEGGAGLPGGGLGFGDLSSLFGGLGSATSLAGDIQSGNVGGTIRDIYGLYSQAAPYLSQLTGQNMPTISSLLQSGASSLGDLFGGIGGGAAGAEAGVGLAPAVAGETAAGAGVAGGAAAGSLAANLLAAGGSAAGAGALTAGLGFAAYPYIQAIMNGLSQMGGFGFSEQEQQKVKNTFKEMQRNVKNIGTAAPIIQQGALLPDEFKRAEAGGDPAQIAALVERARNITDQGPALSQVQPGIQGWGQFKNPYAGNEAFSQAMSRNMHNAYNVYGQGMADLAHMGTLSPYMGTDPNLRGTLMFNGQGMFGGSSPIAQQTYLNAMGGVDPFGYQALMQGWFGNPMAKTPESMAGGLTPELLSLLYGQAGPPVSPGPEYGSGGGDWSGASSAGVGPGSSSAGTY